MKLGIVSAIYDGFTFEEAVENAVQNGCECTVLPTNQHSYHDASRTEWFADWS